MDEIIRRYERRRFISPESAIEGAKAGQNADADRLIDCESWEKQEISEDAPDYDKDKVEISCSTCLYCIKRFSQKGHLDKSIAK